MEQKKLSRKLILEEARRWVGYTESDWDNLQEYDSKGGNGRNNYNRFSYIFDKLLAPKAYAGGNKDGFAWCATFVTACIGTATFEIKDYLAHEIAMISPAKKMFLRNEMLDNLNDALCLKGEPLQSASLLAGVGSFPKFTAIKPCTLDEVAPADLVIFGKATCATAHIGLVESAGGGQFVTIEGNTKMGEATPNGGQVCRKTYAPNGEGLVELRNNQRFKSWDNFTFYKIKVK